MCASANHSWKKLYKCTFAKMKEVQTVYHLISNLFPFLKKYKINQICICFSCQISTILQQSLIRLNLKHPCHIMQFSKNQPHCNYVAADLFRSRANTRMSTASADHISSRVHMYQVGFHGGTGEKTASTPLIQILHTGTGAQIHDVTCPCPENRQIRSR
jgi:hypothetical protein